MAMPKVIAIVKSSLIANFSYLFNIAILFKNLFET